MALSLGDAFDRFVEQSPVTVMARATLEHALSASELDALFERTAKNQYTRELLFSSCVELMTMVVCKIQPAIHAAFQELSDTLPVTITSVYNKLNALEPALSRALVQHTAQRFAPVIQSMGATLGELVPGYRVKILDGNHLAATERRLDVLRGSHAGPLPGQSIVVLDPALMLATDVFPCEDGHRNERSLFEAIVETVQPNDLWVGDRAFCTTLFLVAMAARQAFFVIREHATNAPWHAVGKRLRRGRCETGVVYEQQVALLDPKGETLTLRRITVELDKPTREGDRAIHLLTNLPKGKEGVGAKMIVNVYRKRWTLEVLFHELTITLCCEVNTLGYPRAALFGFCVALMAYNVVSVVQAALRAEHGRETIEKDVSEYFLANEIRRTHDGMMIAVPPPKWKRFRTMSAKKLGDELRWMASHARLRAYKKHPRGPKKPVPKRTRFRNKKHVSTARLLAQARQTPP